MHLSLGTLLTKSKLVDSTEASQCCRPHAWQTDVMLQQANIRPVESFRVELNIVAWHCGKLHGVFIALFQA
jgi:hypothetical protein